MAGLYAPNGTLNVTVVDGSSFVGRHAPDGSLNVVVAPDPVTIPVGLYAPCGALYVTVYQGSGPTGSYAPDGSLYVVEGVSTSGAIPVTVVSGSLGGGGSPPAWLPSGAVAYADFVNGYYYADGAETTLGAMWVENATFGTWDPANVVASVGLQGSNDSYPTAGNWFTGSLVDGITAVFAVQTPVTGEAATVDFWKDPEFDPYMSMDARHTSSSVSPGPSVTYGSTTFVKVAVTMLNDGTAALSVNGSAVDSGSVSAGGIFNALSISAGANTVIKSLAVYAPKPNADLPALSSIA